MSLQIELAYDNLARVKELFLEYHAKLGIDLCFQSFQRELDTLPGKYAPPLGRLYTAAFGSDLAGCIALRPLDGNRCEMKRLYVREPFRGLGVGRALAEKVIADAKEMGYDAMLLDTLSSMKQAISLYRRLGFAEIEPYYHNPNEGVVFLGLGLR